MVEPIGKAYKPWVIASVGVLVGSLMLLAGTVGAAFVYFNAAGTPLWVMMLGALAVLGIGVGFGGFFVMMMVAGWRSFREGRRVQVLPPRHEG